MYIDLMKGYYDNTPDNTEHNNIVLYYKTPDMSDWDQLVYHETDMINRDPEQMFIPRREIRDISVKMTIYPGFKAAQLPALLELVNQFQKYHPGTKYMILDGNKRDALLEESRIKVAKFNWKHRKEPLLPVPSELYFNYEDYGKYIMAFHNGKDKWKLDRQYLNLFKRNRNVQNEKCA